MMKYKKGDRLVNENGFEREVLEVIGRIYFMSRVNSFEALGNAWTSYDLDTDGYTLKSRPKEDWTPEEGKAFWCISTDGLLMTDIWRNSNFDNKVKNFLGVYKTAAEAEARLQEIKDKLK